MIHKTRIGVGGMVAEKYEITVVGKTFLVGSEKGGGIRKNSCGLC